VASASVGEIVQLAAAAVFLHESVEGGE